MASAPIPKNCLPPRTPAVSPWRFPRNSAAPESPQRKLETTCTISLEKVGEGFSITKSHLDLVANIPGADKAKFDAAVKAAETGCPVSKLFKAEISVNAQLVS